MSAEVVFQLFEGSCPDCDAEVVITGWGGTKKFLRDFEFTEGKRVEWQERDDPIDGEDGFVEFRCKNGHEHYVGHVGGDWAC